MKTKVVKVWSSSSVRTERLRISTIGITMLDDSNVISFLPAYRKTGRNFSSARCQLLHVKFSFDTYLSEKSHEAPLGHRHQNELLNVPLRVSLQLYNNRW